MENEEKLESFKWWNSQLESTSSLDRPPDIVLPCIASKIWTNVCPMIQIMVSESLKPSEYWDSIRTIISRFVQKESVPNPISQFPDFNYTIYQIRQIINPKRVDDCINFIDRFQAHDSDRFFLYQSPIYFVDPLLYFKTLVALKDIKHSLWKKFSSNSQLTDSFFELHLGFLSPIKKGISGNVWDHRLYLAEVFYTIIRENIKSAQTLQNSIKFSEACIKLLPSAPYEFKCHLFRYIHHIIKLTHNRLTREQLQTRCVTFLQALDQSDPSLFMLALRYVTTLKPPVVSAARILKIISHHGIRSLTDIEIVSAMAEGNGALHSLTFLAKQAIFNPLWHRSCISEITWLLLKFSSRADVREWFAVFIRRLMVFISLAYPKRKYIHRSLLICESLSSFLTVKLLWLQQSVLSAAASIFSTHQVPSYFKFFFPLTSPIDEGIVHEYEQFLTVPIHLKTFPFDPIKGSLVLPPLSDLHKNAPISQRSQGTRASAREYHRQDRISTRSNQPNVQRMSKKRTDPIITKPYNIKAKNLACVLYVTPANRK